MTLLMNLQLSRDSNSTRARPRHRWLRATNLVISYEGNFFRARRRAFSRSARRCVRNCSHASRVKGSAVASNISAMRSRLTSMLLHWPSWRRTFLKIRTSFRCLSVRGLEKIALKSCCSLRLRTLVSWIASGSLRSEASGKRTESFCF